jgi:hypothetical protein
MLSRLSLVIHWLGFIGSVLGTLWVIYGITTYGTEDIDTDEWLIIAGVIVGPLSVGWVFRFITTSHKSPLPWVANKEKSSEG